MDAVEIHVRSANGKRVVVPNSQDAAFQTVLPSGSAPTMESTTGQPTDGGNGAWFIGGEGQGHPLLWFQPFALALPGQTFSVQVWGYRHVIDGQQRGQNVWAPAFLAELACTVADVPGIEGGSVLAAERFCDTIQLTAGSLGYKGEVCSPATGLAVQAIDPATGQPTTAVVPGSQRPGLPGWFVLNPRGSRFFRAVFAGENVSMNALWAPLS